MDWVVMFGAWSVITVHLVRKSHSAGVEVGREAGYAEARAVYL